MNKQLQDFCIKNGLPIVVTFSNHWINDNWKILLEEYNTDTSAEHPIKDDDIVRTIEKSIESRNKDA